MMRSLYAGVSALRNHQVQMDVVANNIANVNTVGFKASRVTFVELLNQVIRGASPPQTGSGGARRGGVNPLQVGNGMAVGSIDVLFGQGNLQRTGRETDLAIEGNGFFLASDGKQRYLTRAGNFVFDEAGDLTTASGLLVQGWTAIDGVVNPSEAPQAIRIDREARLDGAATTRLSLAGNLDAGSQGALSLGPNPLSFGVEIGGSSEAAQLSLQLTPTEEFNKFRWSLSGSGNVVLDALAARTTTGTPAGPDEIRWTAVTAGPGGNAIQVELVDPGAANSPLSVSVAGDTITVTLATDATGAIVSTVSDVVAAVNANANASTRVRAEAAPTANPSAVVSAAALQSLQGGRGALPTSGTVTLQWVPASSSYQLQWADESGGAIDPATGLQATVRSSSDPFQVADVALTLADTLGPAGTVDLLLTSNNNLTGATASTLAYQPPKTGLAASVYDSQGESHVYTFEFVRRSHNQWDWSIPELNDPNSPPVEGTLNFFTSGRFQGVVGGPLVDRIPGRDDLSVELDFSGITQQADETSLGVADSDGFPPGALDRLAVDESGRILGVFTNEQVRVLAQVALARVDNPEGLVMAGQGTFTVSTNAGELNIGTAGTGGLGNVVAGSLEMSNVQLSDEFTNLIVTQRGFQANSRVINASDELLQELINLRR